jgi:lysophospholipase L1-like esterase
VGVGRPFQQCANSARLPGAQDGTPWIFQLNLPLYNGVTSVELGVPAGFTVEPLVEPGRRPAVCFYGTSIVQGGCASRPGMAYPAILGRHLGIECINLGFSGSARAEPEMAELLARLDPRAYVLDPLPNMSTDTISDRFAHLVRTLRSAHPRTPLILVEHVRPSWLPLPAGRPWAEEWSKANTLMNGVVDAMRKDGMKGLTVVPWKDLMGDDYEATVDGIHPTDLGFVRMAEVIEAAVRGALGLR